MFVITALLGLILVTSVPMDPIPRHDCLSIVSPTRNTSNENVRSFIASASGFKERVSGEYVLCEIEHHPGNVQSILFLKDGSGVATMRDETKIQFQIPASSGAWFAAKAASSGAKLSSSEPLDLEKFDSSSSVSSGAKGPGVVGIIALLFSVAFIGALAFKWQQRRTGKVLVHGSQRALANQSRSDVPQTRFKDVAGCKEAVEDLQEIVEVLKHPERFTAVGARTPKGALLVGPPGTGKTLLARAVAGEAGVPFFSAAGSDFVEMYVGVGARRVRELFEKARKAGGGIVFIDEIDAVGRKRSQNSVSGGEGETENTLISLLNELDGFRSSNVVVLAATNRPEVLDPALMRPGRLDRRVHVALPDIEGRAEILQVHLREKPTAQDVNLDTLARRTPGMSGAYVVMGRARRSAKIDEQDRLVTAWHEAGHAVCAMRQEGAAPPVAVSIVPRGQAGGVTWMSQTDSQILSRAQLRARLVVALGGRVAEELLLNGEHTAGAASDLEEASNIARQMVDRFGMTDRGLAVRPGGSDSSEEAVEVLLGEALSDARALLEENRALVESLVRELLEHNDLDEDALRQLSLTH